MIIISVGLGKFRYEHITKKTSQIRSYTVEQTEKLLYGQNVTKTFFLVLLVMNK